VLRTAFSVGSAHAESQGCGLLLLITYFINSC
jgi:hypothetical protein